MLRSQFALGCVSDAKAKINSLFGTSWELHEGKNGITTMHTMMPEKHSEGSFDGDFTQRLETLAQHDTAN
jgi:hypothetical protein